MTKMYVGHPIMALNSLLLNLAHQMDGQSAIGSPMTRGNGSEHSFKVSEDGRLECQGLDKDSSKGTSDVGGLECRDFELTDVSPVTSVSPGWQGEGIFFKHWGIRRTAPKKWENVTVSYSFHKFPKQE